MKSLVLILAAYFLISTGISAQEGYDYMGIPSDYKSPVATDILTLKSTQILITPVIKQFPSPSSLPTSIAFHDGFLWVIGYNDYVVYKVSPSTGDVAGTIPISIQKPYGITFLNNSLCILDNNSKKVFVYTNSGVVLDTIDLALVSNPLYPTGLCFADNEFWYNDTKGPNPSAANDSIFGFSEQLVTNHEFESVGAFPSGITYDGNYLWVNDNPSQTTNMLDPISHSVVKSFKAPGGAYPNGVAFDGQGLWIINNASDSIYFMIPEGITSINSISDNPKSINIYSSGNQIYFNYKPEWAGSEIIIFDCTAKVICNKTLPSGSADSWDTTLDGINNGIYLVCVYNKESKFSEKVILNR